MTALVLDVLDVDLHVGGDDELDGKAGMLIANGRLVLVSPEGTRLSVSLGARERAWLVTELCADDLLSLEAAQDRAITRALGIAKGNVAKAAELLRIGRATLYRRIASKT